MHPLFEDSRKPSPNETSLVTSNCSATSGCSCRVLYHQLKAPPAINQLIQLGLSKLCFSYRVPHPHPAARDGTWEEGAETVDLVRRKLLQGASPPLKDGLTFNHRPILGRKQEDLASGDHTWQRCIQLLVFPPVSQDGGLLQSPQEEGQSGAAGPQEEMYLHCLHRLAQKTKVFWLSWRKLWGATTTDPMGAVDTFETMSWVQSLWLSLLRWKRQR